MTRILLLLSIASVACSAPILITQPAPSAQITPTVAVTSTPTEHIQLAYIPAVVTAYETVYLRRDPSTRHAPLGVLVHGQAVQVVSCDGIWAQLVTGEFVNSLYLSVSCPIP